MPNILKTATLLFILPFIANLAFTHDRIGGFNSGPDRTISFPDTKDYLTISSDLHTHSVFSDGHVWPNIRVAEAEKDSIDVLAITEHLEYQPHTNFIPNEDRNAAYLEAKKASEGTDLIVIAGSEITREMPPGHMNAIFIRDANKLFNIDLPKNDKEKEILNKKIREMQWGAEPAIKEHYILGNMWPAEKAVEAANQQGAFLFWNHPDWYRQATDGIARLKPMHRKMINKGYLHGIEVVNGSTYSEEAFRIAIENNLALIGTSDVHDLIEWDYLTRVGEHRPVTLIFTKDRSKESIKEALFQRRTVVWFKEILIGKEDNLLPLLESIISIESVGYDKGTQILNVIIKNNSSAKLQLKNQSRFTFLDSTNLIDLPGNDKIKLRIKTLKKLDNLQLEFEVLNALITPSKNPKVMVSTKI